MRIGLREMRAFSKLMFSTVKDTTFFESCGVADLITTCRMKTTTSPSFPSHKFLQSPRDTNVPVYAIHVSVGGRNRRVAEAFAKCGGKRSFLELSFPTIQSFIFFINVPPSPRVPLNLISRFSIQDPSMSLRQSCCTARSYR